MVSIWIPTTHIKVRWSSMYICNPSAWLDERQRQESPWKLVNQGIRNMQRWTEILYFKQGRKWKSTPDAVLWYLHILRGMHICMFVYMHMYTHTHTAFVAIHFEAKKPWSLLLESLIKVSHQLRRKKAQLEFSVKADNIDIIFLLYRDILC